MLDGQNGCNWADVATIPFGVNKKMFKHPLTDIGLQTFLKDWKKLEK